MRGPLSFIILLAFLANTFGPLPTAQANEFHLPAPGVMVSLSPEFNLPILKGIKVHPENPFRFEFILDKGDYSLPSVGKVKEGDLKQESAKLIKYFLASLTIPEKDLWVNLSPYEKNRIVPHAFGQTEMGRDLLAEDYMLKQITASLIYPEGAIGKKFWKRIYAEAEKKFGTTDIPVNTFNKVWIVPEKAVVYENAKAGTAYVVESRLKVMLEQDYLSLQKYQSQPGRQSGNMFKSELQRTGSQIVREIVIPELTEEVNNGKNFAQLRQVYNSFILAAWYKKKIKDSILAKVYEDKNKVVGVEYGKSVILGPAKDLNRINSIRDSSDSPQNDTERIYQRYLQAFKKGAYNYIKEEINPITQQTISRKYFSGGIDLAMGATHLGGQALSFESDASTIEKTNSDLRVEVDINPAMTIQDKAILSRRLLLKASVASSLFAMGADSPITHQAHESSRIMPGTHAWIEVQNLIEEAKQDPFIRSHQKYLDAVNAYQRATMTGGLYDSKVIAFAGFDFDGNKYKYSDVGINLGVMRKFLNHSSKGPIYKRFLFGLLIKEGVTVIDHEKNPNFYRFLITLDRGRNDLSDDLFRIYVAMGVEGETLGYRALLDYLKDADQLDAQDLISKFAKLIKDESDVEMKRIFWGNAQFLSSISNDDMPPDVKELYLKATVYVLTFSSILDEKGLTERLRKYMSQESGDPDALKKIMGLHYYENFQLLRPFVFLIDPNFFSPKVSFQDQAMRSAKNSKIQEISYEGMFNRRYILKNTSLLAFLAASIPAPRTAKAAQNQENSLFEPQGNQILTMIGQDAGSIDQYVKGGGKVPAGFMTYTSIQDLEGLGTASDRGAGIQNAQDLIDRYPNTVLQIGLYLKGALGDSFREKYSPKIKELADWFNKNKKTPMFLRIGYEFDYPGNEYKPQEYVQAYRYIVDELRRQGVRNVVFVWHSVAYDFHQSSFKDYYPGREYVDWFGLTYFNKGNEPVGEQIIKFAKEENRSVMVAEASPWEEQSPQAKQAWFNRFFDFVFKNNIKAVGYINGWDKRMYPGKANTDANSTDIKGLWDNTVNNSTRFVHSSPDLYKSINFKPDKAMSNTSYTIETMGLKDMIAIDLGSNLTRGIIKIEDRNIKVVYPTHYQSRGQIQTLDSRIVKSVLGKALEELESEHLGFNDHLIEGIEIVDDISHPIVDKKPRVLYIPLQIFAVDPVFGENNLTGMINILRNEMLKILLYHQEEGFMGITDDNADMRDLKRLGESPLDFAQVLHYPNAKPADYHIVVPIYNEGPNIDSILSKVKSLGYLHRITFVNDASTDDSKAILQRWQAKEGIEVLHLEENMKKEGAIREVLRMLKRQGRLSDKIVLMDSDTFLAPRQEGKSFEEVITQASAYMDHENISGMTFRMDPFLPDKPNFLQKAQYAEYMTIRFWNRITNWQKQLWVINGPGGIFRGDQLLATLENMVPDFESGDLLITVKLLKQGYHVAYYTDITAKTEVPRTASELFKQRRRWERGTTKILFNERGFYLKQILDRKILGPLAAFNAASSISIVVGAPLLFAMIVKHLYPLTLGNFSEIEQLSLSGILHHSKGFFIGYLFAVGINGVISFIDPHIKKEKDRLRILKWLFLQSLAYNAIVLPAKAMGFFDAAKYIIKNKGKNKLDVDQAILAAGLNKGGIDLTSDKALSMQNNGQGIKFHIDPAQLRALQNASGFTPVIINIDPITDLPAFLGISSHIV